MSILGGWGQERQRELDRGVDADLVDDNRRRFWLALVLLAVGFLLAWLGVRIGFSHILRVIVVGTGVVSLIVGSLMAGWARWEWNFLHQANPEDPPSIIKG